MGIIKRIHVNQHTIKSNGKQGKFEPTLSLVTSTGTIHGHGIEIEGTSEVIYRPEKPLSCGAHVWIETRSRVWITNDLTGISTLIE